MQNDRKYTYLKILEPLIKNVQLEQQSGKLRSDTLIKNVHFANHLTKIFDQKMYTYEMRPLIKNVHFARLLCKLRSDSVIKNVHLKFEGLDQKCTLQI